MEVERKSLTQLFIPICLETLCYMLAGMIDTLMLSSAGDKAVGAVGTANTYIGIFIIMFSVISSGMIAVMTQYIGAGRVGVAYQARQIGLIFNAILGMLLSLFLFFGAGTVLETVGVAELLMDYAKTYLKIVGGSCILNALIPIFSSYLRAFGHTREPLAATIVGNILNLILNAVFLFIFDLGVMGVAIATVISRILNLLIVVYFSHRLVHAGEEPERLPNREVLGQIVHIGLPSALETALYNVAMTLVIRFLNQMDSDGINVTARSYAVQITNFSYCVGAALAQANAIMTGWRIGAQEYEECDRGTRKAAIVGICVATIMETLIALSSGKLLLLFTDDSVMLELVGKLLAIDIVLEIGRVSNLVFGNALKTSGDAVFTTVIASIFMYLCAVGGTYLFGIRMEMMVVGAYIGLAMDECIRAICMFFRWKSGKWREKELITR
ncbi:MATE family efflux transporter [Roseburia sp. 499]|uniref:MATE family efflux transporter n=1 Tax=Roseburia sp. 499 TaxID=1261634 RepID=UPI0009510323|nr:MATE family efflux transporter [Roseburia sp. 499]WVK68962.1 MATE family efflux transporter [Roseburia sp. 499]